MMYLKSIPYIFCDFRVYIPWNFTLKWWCLLELNRKHMYLYLEQSMSIYSMYVFQFSRLRNTNGSWFHVSSHYILKTELKSTNS